MNINMVDLREIKLLFTIFLLFFNSHFDICDIFFWIIRYLIFFILNLNFKNEMFDVFSRIVVNDESFKLWNEKKKITEIIIIFIIIDTKIKKKKRKLATEIIVIK